MDMGMDHGSSDAPTGPACKISMLWNWFTVDSCFISTQWHVHTKVQFAFSVIGIFIIVALVEGVRRLGREYDKRLLRQARRNLAVGTTKDTSNEGLAGGTTKVIVGPTNSQQIIRAFIFMVQFGAAYMLMLIGMYYNGYMLLAIIFGGGVGHFIFGKDTLVLHDPEADKGATCC